MAGSLTFGRTDFFVAYRCFGRIDSFIPVALLILPMEIEPSLTRHRLIDVVTDQLLFPDFFGSQIGCNVNGRSCPSINAIELKSERFSPFAKSGLPSAIRPPLTIDSFPASLHNEA